MGGVELVSTVLATVPRICGHSSEGPDPLERSATDRVHSCPCFQSLPPDRNPVGKGQKSGKGRRNGKTPLITTTTKRGKTTDRWKKPIDLRRGSRARGINYKYYAKLFAPTQSAPPLPVSPQNIGSYSRIHACACKLSSPMATTAPPLPPRPHRLMVETTLN